MNPQSPVLIACGGTGGHLFPGIAVAQALRVRGIPSLLAISEKMVDRTASQSYGDLEFLPLSARPFPRLWSPAIFPFLWGALRSLRQCQVAMTANQIGAVLGMGGFTTMMPVLAGRLAGVPVFLHDSNAIPGKANRMAARYAHTVFLGLAEAANHLGKTPFEVVGTPVREELHHLPDRAEAAHRLDLDPSKKTLLVLGGSQGARALNRVAVDALASFDPGSVQAILLTGAADNQGTLDYVREKKLPHTLRVFAFCRDMPAAYASSDMVLARAGASTLSELAVVGLPAVLVPYPHAADDHQTANAQAYCQRGAAELLPESRLSGSTLAASLRQWWANPANLGMAAAKMRECAFPQAAGTMADRIASLVS